MSKHEIGCLKHCPGGGGGVSALTIVAGIVVVVLSAALWKVRHGVETGLEIISWVMLIVIGLGALLGAIWIGVRIYAEICKIRSGAAARQTIPASYSVVHIGTDQNEQEIRPTAIRSRLPMALETARKPEVSWQPDRLDPDRQILSWPSAWVKRRREPDS
jgi:hypothetical protein